MGKLAATVAIVASTFALSSCAEQEPSNGRAREVTPVLEILVLDEHPEQVVRAELYAQTMTRMGREATLKLVEPGVNPVSELSRGRGDIYIACAGEQVELNNPSEAEKLRTKYAEMEGTNSPASLDEKREDAYVALMASLIKHLDATDPSNAVGCSYAESDSDTELANNLVPIYRVPLLEREERQMLNHMSGTLSTVDLGELVEKAESGQSRRQIVSDYLDEKDI